MALTTYLTFPEINLLFNHSISDKEIREVLSEVNKLGDSPFLIEEFPSEKRGLFRQPTPVTYTLYNAINFPNIEALRESIRRSQPGVDEFQIITFYQVPDYSICRMSCTSIVEAQTIQGYLIGILQGYFRPALYRQKTNKE